MKKKELALIVCSSRNGVIGRQGSIPWHFPTDLARFQKLTMGHVLIMGRKTYESIGSPLKGRWTIVVTSQRDYQLERGETAFSVEAALDKAYKKDTMPFICGGEQIYKATLAKVTKIYLTLIDQEYEGDSFFEMPEKWQAVVSEKCEQVTFLELTKAIEKT